MSNKKKRAIASSGAVAVFFVLFAVSWQVLGHPDLLVAAILLVLQALGLWLYFRAHPTRSV